LFYFTTPLETLLQINAYYESSEESLYSCRGLVYHFCHKDLIALRLLNGLCQLSLPAHLQGSILLALRHKIPELHKTGGLENHFLRWGQRFNRRQRLIRDLARLCWNFLIDKKRLRVRFESMINLLLGSFFLLPLRWDLLNYVFYRLFRLFELDGHDGISIVGINVETDGAWNRLLIIDWTCGLLVFSCFRWAATCWSDPSDCTIGWICGGRNFLPLSSFPSLMWLVQQIMLTLVNFGVLHSRWLNLL